MINKMDSLLGGRRTSFWEKKHTNSERRKHKHKHTTLFYLPLTRTTRTHYDATAVPETSTHTPNRSNIQQHTTREVEVDRESVCVRERERDGEIEKRQQVGEVEQESPGTVRLFFKTREHRALKK